MLGDKESSGDSKIVLFSTDLAQTGIEFVGSSPPQLKQIVNINLPLVCVFYECWHGTDLHGVGIIGWVLKEAIVGIEEFPWQQEEELPRRTTVVKSEVSTVWSKGTYSDFHWLTASSAFI